MSLKATIAISSVARAMASKLLPPAGVVVASFSSTPTSCKLGPGLLPCPLQRRGRRHGFLVAAPSLRRQSFVSATASVTQPGQQQAESNGERPQANNWQQPNNGPQQSNWQQPNNGPQQNNWQQQPNNGPQQSNWQQQPNNAPQQSNWQQQPNTAPQQSNWQQPPNTAPQQSNWQQPPNNVQQSNGPQQTNLQQPPSNALQQSNRPQTSNWQQPNNAPQPNNGPQPNTGGRPGPYKRREKLPRLYPFDDRFPITIITGWKGSGKTTVMNKICNAKPYLKVAVITNEFGDVIIDDSAITIHQSGVDEIVTLNSKDGTKSTTIREDLVVMLAELLEKKRSRRVHFDYVLVETTELAPIPPIFNTFHVETAVAARVRIDAIVAVLDGEHALRRLNEVKPDGGPNDQAAQIGYADRIIINKIDKMGEADQEELVQRIKKMNPIAKIHKTTQGDVDLEFVFGAKAFCKRRISEFLDNSQPPPQSFVADPPTAIDRVSTMFLTFEGEVDLDLINEWVINELQANKDDNYRFKGQLAISGYDNTYVFQGMSTHYEGFVDRAWENRERKINKFYIIGRNLNERALRAGFLKCIKRR